MITAKTLRITKTSSKYGGSFFYLFLKGVDGKSYRTCLYPNCRNFSRWRRIIKMAENNKEIWLTGLRERKKGLIDADSKMEIQ